jgi:hypothetical protein
VTRRWSSPLICALAGAYFAWIGIGYFAWLSPGIGLSRAWAGVFAGRPSRHDQASGAGA